MEKTNPEWVKKILSELNKEKESKTPPIDTNETDSDS